MKSTTLIVGLAVIAGGAASAYAPTGDYISGRVTDERTGKPLAGICVRAATVGALDEVGVETQRDGYYSVDDLEPGEFYEVTFYPCRETPFAAEAYNDRPAIPPFFDLNEDVHFWGRHPDWVQAPASGIDAALGPAGYISGRVTDAVTGEPLAGMCVWEGVALTPEDTTRSRADGSYVITVPYSGETRISFSDCEQHEYGYIHENTQRYDGDHDGVADLVTVTPPDVTHVDTALVPTGSIAGRVRDRLTGDPIAGACVSADAEGGPSSLRTPSVFGWWNYHREARTNLGGRLKLRNLAPGLDYYVRFSVDCSNRGVYYGSDQVVVSIADEEFAEMGAEPVAVRAGATTRIVYGLLPYGRISGTVSEAATGRPLASACVWPVTLAADLRFDHTLTDTFGRYTFELPPGHYVIRFAHPAACAAAMPPPSDDNEPIDDTLYNDVALYYAGAGTADDATKVRVRPGRTTGGIDHEV